MDDTPFRKHVDNMVAQLPDAHNMLVHRVPIQWRRIIKDSRMTKRALQYDQQERWRASHAAAARPAQMMPVQPLLRRSET